MHLKLKLLSESEALLQQPTAAPSNLLYTFVCIGMCTHITLTCVSMTIHICHWCGEYTLTCSIGRVYNGIQIFVSKVCDICLIKDIHYVLLFNHMLHLYHPSCYIFLLSTQSKRFRMQKWVARWYNFPWYTNPFSDGSGYTDSFYRKQICPAQRPYSIYVCGRSKPVRENSCSV